MSSRTAVATTALRASRLLSRRTTAPSSAAAAPMRARSAASKAFAMAVPSLPSSRSTPSLASSSSSSTSSSSPYPPRRRLNPHPLPLPPPRSSSFPLPPPRSLKDAIETSPGGESVRDDERDASAASAASAPASPDDSDPPPSKEALAIWAKSDVVCFDIDCTVTTEDSLDMLARFLGKGEAVARLTDAAMEGEMPLEEALRRRLEILDVTPNDLARFHDRFPARGRLTDGAKELVSALMERGKRVYLISGGFRELALPVARELGVPAENLFANRMNFQIRDDSSSRSRRRKNEKEDQDDDTIGVGVGAGSGDARGDSGSAGGESSSSSSDGEEWGSSALRVAGFDPSEEVSANGGKPRAIKKIRASLPYSLVTMVGDGITDAEAASVPGGADLFVGFGGVVRRPAVAAAAPWFVSSFATLARHLPSKRKVAMVGSGAWACAAAKVVAENLLKMRDFDDELTMWVFEEDVEWPPTPTAEAATSPTGKNRRKLSDVINEANENVKYLPGVKLGPNVRAEPDLVSSVRGADVLLFCAPHQHAGGIVRGLVGAIGAKSETSSSPSSSSSSSSSSTASTTTTSFSRDVVALSLIKGMRVRPEGPQLISAMIERVLGVETGVLMGANIAEEVARGGLTEATVAARNPATAELFVRLFSTESFVVRACSDRVGVEMAGTLKNVVALAVGLATGLGAGENAKGALLRAGMGEMLSFASSVVVAAAEDSGSGVGGFGGGSVQATTMLEACGIADVVASSYGGRNARVAAEYARRVTKGDMPPGSQTVDALERELLAGQSLQGDLTSRECSAAIEHRFGRPEGLRRFPLFGTVRAIFDGRLRPEEVLRYRAAAAELSREASVAEGAVRERAKEEEEDRIRRKSREPAGV